MSDLIVPILTPFTDLNSVDKIKLRRHGNQLLANGIDYLFLCGTTGLGPSLTFSEKVQVLETFSDIPEKIILQVGSLNLEESKKLAFKSKEAGISCIAALPPFYYPRVPEEWYIRYFTEISKIYPTLVYNFPLTTNYNLTPNLVKKINLAGGNIIGIKDTTPDLNHMLNFKWEFSNDFKVYCGPDSLLFSGLRSKLDGAVPGSGNYAPRLVKSIFENYNNDKGIESQRLLTSLTIIAQKYGQWGANYSLVKILEKYDVGKPRPPIYSLSEDIELELRKDLQKFNLGGD